MRVEVTVDGAAFEQRVFPFLRRDPVLNSVILSIVAGRAERAAVEPQPPVYAAVLDAGEVVGAAFSTAMRGVFLGGLDEEYAAPLADALADVAPEAPIVDGTAAAAAAFARRWRTLFGGEVVPGNGTRLHLLGTLTTTPTQAAAPGRARLAGAPDSALVVDWVTAFGQELGLPGIPLVELLGSWVDDRRVWLWEHGGRVTSLVGHQVPAFGVTRVGPVFTPPDQRGSGYASALTAHVSAVLLDAGSQVCLYTELDNPTSNRIYAAIGFEPVADFVRYDLRPARFTST